MDDDTIQNHSPAPRLPFPPLTRSHILHCSIHRWHPRYRSITPKARLIPLTPPFITYLRSDGILLPPEPYAQDVDFSSTETDSGIFSSPSTPTSTFSNNKSTPPDRPQILKSSTIFSLNSNSKNQRRHSFQTLRSHPFHNHK